MDSSQWFARKAQRRRTRSIFVCTLAFVVTGVASASAALPDLVSDPVTSPQLGVYADDGGGQRLLLRFDSYVHNTGPGPLAVRFGVTGPGGAGDTAGEPQQLIDGTWHDMPAPAEVVFETGSLTNEDGHDHWHLQRAAAYELALPAGGSLVAPAQKVGFCLLDSLPVESSDPPVYGANCQRASGTVTMGVSAGWRDLYTRNLAHQWVDVSDVVPGQYALRAWVDPDGLIAEADEANPPSERAVVVAGYVAKPRIAADVVQLEGTPFVPSGGLAAPQYRIEKAPAHGTVDRPVGVWFGDPTVRYTPADPASPVPDAIEYVVRAGDSAFPRTPPRATVAFGGGERLAIGGAPATLVAGTSVQLSAAGPTGGGVAWSATAGSVTQDGLYTAPAVPGPVTVRAATPAGAADAVTIDVVAPPVPQPAPLPSTAPAGDPATPPARTLTPLPPVFPRRAIEKASAERTGRYVVVAVTPGRAGVVRVALRRSGRTLRSCRVRASAGRSVTCRLRRPPSGRGPLRVVVQVGKVARAVPIRAGHVH